MQKLLGGLLVAIPAFVGACTNPSPTPAPDIVHAAEIARVPTPAPASAKPAGLGKFQLTFYYVASEEEIDGPEPQAVAANNTDARLTSYDSANGQLLRDAGGAANDNVAKRQLSSDARDAQPILAAIAPGKKPIPGVPTRVTIFDEDGCSPIAEVSRDFAMELQMQGTGQMRDGRVVNIWGDCRCARSPCFRVIGRQWGNAGNGRALVPFRTVAVDPKKIPVGQLLYIKALDGRKMPGRAPWGGFVHDGCVAGDDTGGGINGAQLDLFVGRRSFYRSLARRKSGRQWAREAVVVDGSSMCERRGGRVHKVRKAS